MKIFNWIATLWRGTIEFKTRAAVLRRLHRHVPDRRHHRHLPRRLPGRLAAHRHLLRRRPPALRAHRRRGVRRSSPGIYYWFPKITGRMLSEGLGKAELLADARRLPRHLPDPALARPRRHAAAHLRVPRRRPPRALQPDLDDRLVHPRRRRPGHGRSTCCAASSTGAIAGPDPWKGNTLEWFTTSPPPVNNFDVVPRVRSVEPMKDIRRQVERQTGADRAAPAARGRVRGARLMAAPARRPPSRSPPLAGVRQVVADYVALTKPKVQSLLLLTTVTTMLVAGDPSVGLILLTCLGGYLSRGRRRRGQPLLRPRHRRADGAHRRPAGAGRARLAARRR